MYAVFGVSGNTGSAVAETLLSQGHPVRAVVRRSEAATAVRQRGAEVAVADLADADALAKALTGVDGAYVITPPLLDLPDPDAAKRPLFRAIRDAAERSGAPALVVLSSVGAHLPSGTGPVVSLHELEGVLADYPGRASFLRAPYFLDNWMEAVGLATEQGIFPSLMAPGVAIEMASTADIGRTAAELLLEHHSGHRIVELESSPRYSAQDVASALGRTLGRTLEVVYPPRDQWLDILTDAGLSKAGAEQMAELMDSINDGRIGFSGQGERRTALEGPAALFQRLLRSRAA
jgi:uncharacterized protein YbjT (DUF2867 family)